MRLKNKPLLVNNCGSIFQTRFYIINKTNLRFNISDKVNVVGCKLSVRIGGDNGNPELQLTNPIRRRIMLQIKSKFYVNTNKEYASAPATKLSSA